MFTVILAMDEDKHNKIVVYAGSHGCKESKRASETKKCVENLNASWQAFRLLLYRS